MTAILGISAFYHDSAAALLIDGEVVAAAQEERFTRKKHDAGFPKNAVDYCLREVNITIDDVEYREQVKYVFLQTVFCCWVFPLVGIFQGCDKNKKQNKKSIDFEFDLDFGQKNKIILKTL